MDVGYPWKEILPWMRCDFTWDGSQGRLEAKGHLLSALPAAGDKCSSLRDSFWAGPQNICAIQKLTILRIIIIKTNFNKIMWLCGTLLFMRYFGEVDFPHNYSVKSGWVLLSLIYRF